MTALKDYSAYSERELFSALTNTQTSISKIQVEKEKIEKKLKDFLNKETLIKEAICKKWNFIPIENSKALQEIKQANFSNEQLQEINAELDKDLQDDTDD